MSSIPNPNTLELRKRRKNEETKQYRKRKDLNVVNTVKNENRTEWFKERAYNEAFNNEWIPYGQIYFAMMGILSREGRFNTVVQEAVDFTINHLGVEKERLMLRSTKKYSGLDTVDSVVDIPTEYDTKPEKYYVWPYGIDGVYGEGLTVSVFNPANEIWFDIGNIVTIYNNNGKELGTEFGYGHEFMLTAVVGVDEALKFSKVFQLFPFELGLAKKYYSTLESVVRMRLAGTQLGDQGVDHMYKQYVKSLQLIGSAMGKSSEDIVTEMTQFVDFLEIKNIKLEKELKFIERHKKRRFC
ncbi:MAG: hypothetical protein WCJ19_01365 [bacterium]